MIPEAAYAMLACARIGAIHSIVFGGFSPDALAGRIEGCESKVVITADEGLRGGRKVPLKANVDEALKKAGGIVQTMIVVKRTGGRDRLGRWPRRLVRRRNGKGIEPSARPTEMNAEDPLFILYTSGSTGKPKGVAAHHRRLSGVCVDDASVCLRLSRRRYLLVHRRCRLGHRPQLYRLRPAGQWRDHADVRGRSELSRSTSRFWEVVDKHKVNIFYTAPTAIRALMGAGEEPVKQTSRASLRLLGSVGEPINPEAWEWYYRVVGDERCPIVDTWWQTETGGILITPLAGRDRR